MNIARDSSESQAIEELPAGSAANRWSLLVSDASIHRRVPWLFSILATVLGLLYILILPPLQAPDEFAHFYRAYGLSRGYFVAPVLTPVPTTIVDLTRAYPPHLEAVRKLRGAELMNSLDQRLKPDAVTVVANQGMNVNSWIPYIPSALAILIARPLNISSLGLLYVSRIANLIGFIVLTWWALRMLPGGQVVVVALGLMPMTLHQAASISWDSIVIGIAFAFGAAVLHFAFRRSLLDRREYLAIVAAVVVVSLCKVDFALLPLILLLPVESFGSRKRQVAFWAICGSAAFVTNAIWQYANRVNLELFRHSIDTLLQAGFPGNIWFLYYDTGYVLNAIGRSIVLTGFFHLTEFVGTFGWLFVRLSPWAVWLYALTLCAVGVASGSGLRWSWFQRSILLGVVILGCTGCVLPMWLATPTWYIRDNILHNTGTLWGIQGRHFIPFALIALWLFANRYVRVPAIVPLAAVTICAIWVNTVALVAIERAFYA